MCAQLLTTNLTIHIHVQYKRAVMRQLNLAFQAVMSAASQFCREFNKALVRSCNEFFSHFVGCNRILCLCMLGSREFHLNSAIFILVQSCVIIKKEKGKKKKERKKEKKSPGQASCQTPLNCVLYNAVLFIICLTCSIRTKVWFVVTRFWTYSLQMRIPHYPLDFMVPPSLCAFSLYNFFYASDLHVFVSQFEVGTHRNS